MRHPREQQGVANRLSPAALFTCVVVSCQVLSESEQLGFAAGAMMFLVIVELIPDALETRKPVEIAWSFMLGFCGMVLVQVVL